MMAAIARVESGRREPLSGRVEPWPWAINAGGEGRYANSQAEAIILVQEYAARGVRSVDVGCMQINLMHHPLAFASLAEAFDPLANARYAARFLRQLQAQVGWDAAIGRYHSATAERAQPYRERVLAAMAGRPIPAGGGAAPVRDWYTVMLSPPLRSCASRVRRRAGDLRPMRPPICAWLVRRPYHRRLCRHVPACR